MTPKNNSRLTAIKKLLANIRHLNSRLDGITTSVHAIHEAQEELCSENKATTAEIAKIEDMIANLRAELARLKETNSQTASPTVNNTVADNHSLDAFYKHFEDEFRGSEQLVSERVAEHLPLFKNLDKKLQKKPIVDIGCGRGEFLRVLTDNNFTAIGIDMNHSMVKRAQEAGLTAIQSDALSYLRTQGTSSLAAITGFHIVEHIPFDALMAIFEESYRTIAHEGFVLFETPNPHNLAVGACNFYMDPSHIHPIPPELLAFALKTVGFDTEIIPLHTAKAVTHDDPLVQDMANMLYGPSDYAVVAHKR